MERLMEDIEKEIVDYANNLLKVNSNKFKELDIVIKEQPRIEVVSELYREFVFTLWNNKKSDLLVVEFPTYIDKKPFCTISQAKEWIKNDIEKFIKESS
ncbi:MAG: hypothetical protein OHK0036_09370 [Bacteroidia bacterium]